MQARRIDRADKNTASHSPGWPHLDRHGHCLCFNPCCFGPAGNRCKEGRSHPMSACIAESLDGHEHNDDVIEYVGICVRGHQRRGPICSACARLLQMRGAVAVTCAECPDDDPRPRILVPADVWDEYPEGTTPA